MSIIRIPTSFNIELDFEVPAFHTRMFAWIIDLFLQIFYLFIVDKIYMELAPPYYSEDGAYNSWAIGLLLILPFFLYHLVMEIVMNGQSVGKRLLNIRVVNENGGRASISQFLIRWLIRASDYTILLFIIFLASSYGPQLIVAQLGAFLLLLTDIVLVAATKKSQRLGDILAHTILIKTNHHGSFTDTVFLEVSDQYVPRFPQIMQLSDKDLNAIKSILDLAIKKDDLMLAASAAEKIKNHLNIKTNMDPMEFLQVLLKDYNYLSVK